MKNKFDLSDFVETITMQSVLVQLVDKEKKRRKAMGISQKALATRSGVSYASIRRFESTGEISFNSLLKIANALECLEDFQSLFATPYIKSLKDYNND